MNWNSSDCAETGLRDSQGDRGPERLVADVKSFSMAALHHFRDQTNSKSPEH